MYSSGVSISVYPLPSLSTTTPPPPLSTIHLNDRPFDDHKSFDVLHMSLSSKVSGLELDRLLMMQYL